MRMSAAVEKKILEMAATDRIVLAERKLQGALDRFLHVIAMYEHNQVVLFTDVLSRQIPRSKAANAFNLFRETLHMHEVVSICALWDSVDLDKFNIPTIIALIDDETVIDLLYRRIYSSWADTPYEPEAGLDEETKALVIKHVKRSNANTGTEQADRITAQLRVAIASAKKLRGSGLLESIMELRDKHIAHALEITRREKASGPIDPVKHGDTGKVLELSVGVMDGLTLGVRNTDFAFDQSRTMHARNAAALWESCTFEIKDRRG